VTAREIPPAVLKHRGVPVRFHALVLGEDGAPVRPVARRFDGDGDSAEPVFEERWLQFTSSVLVDFENPSIGWADLDAWEDALGKSPVPSIVRTIALALELWVPGMSTPDGYPVPDLRRAGTMILDGELDDYAAAIGCAFMLSQGIAPERAGEAMRVQVKAARDLRPLVDTELQRMLAAEVEAQDEAFRLLNEAAANRDTPTNPDGTTSPGTPGTPSGVEGVGTPASSGG
jgi:hypothetical protein